ncbi:MAG: hypothetical protein JRF54_11595 [Deltaproteobacteria bacterium]|nr:hypothetical protein [Deltaproteobacteria bacterium]
MNCEECNEQVLELIEREAVDRDGVREILARCPECRAAFDELKAVLLTAEQLPIEQPPVEVDAAILRAAGARVPEEVPVKKRRLQPAPWAMAAIAMLAVGVGVWTIPQEAAFEGDVAPADERHAEEAVVAEQTREDAGGALAGSLAVAGPTSNTNAPARASERTEAEAKRGSPRPERPRRKARSSRDEPRAGGSAPASASLAMADTATLGAERSQPQEAATKASAPGKQEGADESVQASACRRKVADVERGAGRDEDYAPAEELAIGQCYQELENVTEARKWLERAAAHRETKAAAEKALRQLAPE